MDEKIKELVSLVAQRQEIVRQIEGLEILKQKQEIDNRIEQFKENVRVEIEANKKFKTGKQVADLFGRELELLTRDGALKTEIPNIDEVDKSFRIDRVVEDAIALPDGDIYIKANNDNYYVENGEVKEKLVNEPLIKNIIKAGGDVPTGVIVKKNRPSVSLKLDGQPL